MSSHQLQVPLPGSMPMDWLAHVMYLSRQYTGLSQSVCTQIVGMRRRRQGNASGIEGCIYRMPPLAQACTQAARASARSKCCATHENCREQTGLGPSALPHSSLTHRKHSHPIHALDSSLLAKAPSPSTQPCAAWLHTVLWDTA